VKHNIIFLAAISVLIPTFLIGCNPKSKQAATTSSPISLNKPINDNKDKVNSKTVDVPPKEDIKVPDSNPIITPVDNSVSKGTNLIPSVTPNIKNLSTRKIEWSWAYSPKNNAALLSKYHGYAFGDTSQKNIYLTFDEGYEYGYTASILDTLKAKNVQATFFVTAPYITGSFNGVKDVDLIKRISSEGHIIGNHSVHHMSMPSITDENVFDSELVGVENTAVKIPGVKISKFFRPPMGDFSELSLYYTQKLGYKTIFFSLAYHDYDVKNQPDPETSKKFILASTKPGMICLLHAESKTNAIILDSLIKDWKSEGYTFRTLNELP
jgi:peptidoglycan-N-acetylmuramic acid deacetylase